MNTKTCTKCGTNKPLNDYYNRKDSKDGKRPECKKCGNAAYKAWGEANQEHHRARARAWRETNRERSRLNDRAYAEANRERTRKKNRAWQKANPEKIKANLYARRARKAHAVPQQWKRSLCPDHLCYWCGITLTPEITHIDHIMPISLGGQDTPDNTANTCANCNLTKSNTHPLVWLARITSPEPVC